MTGDEMIEQLRRELHEAQIAKKHAEMDAAIARVDERVAAAAVKAEEAGADAEVAIDLATAIKGDMSAHERECAIRLAVIQKELGNLASLPAAVQALANTITETKTLREVQHQENVKRLDLQDAALSEIKKISGANVISFHKKLVQGLVGLQMLLLAVLAALLQHFVLSKM